ncbi:PREDICTED: targeting protein for Xklp2-like isoform X1 [Rhagoletis zephyria]|uniref:targeting protein for Xklp2-like isoform X1 n=1 Tax=Rhagoletis zephyria TaxID=28612 RepID=UPI0008113075|nr:PREDICTED: targeting protein for Xklp2-like isoform X1 [Rhagoletis zephyria]
MEHVNIKTLQVDNFNWDDIEVGNHVLDHSQNFFGKKHIKHERLDESEGNMDLLKEIDAFTLDDTLSVTEDKENLNVVSTPRSTIKTPLKEIQLTTSVEDEKPDVQKHKIEPGINPIVNEECGEVNEAVHINESPKKSSNITNPANPITLSESLIARNRARINPGGSKKISSSQTSLNDMGSMVSKPVVLSESLIMRNKARINPGAKKEMSTPMMADGSSCSQAGVVAKQASASVPHAYQCNEVYKRRKEEMLRTRLEEERKWREFHSRPVPNFRACHKSLEQKKVVHAVTVPVTPVVLKKSIEAEEKRKKKLEELKPLHQPKFEPRPTTVLHEEPFVPKKAQTVLVACPFNLRSEKRLQERKQYDAAILRTMEEKQKQVEIEEEERKKREEARIKELRKLTTFKARPNPFK